MLQQFILCFFLPAWVLISIYAIAGDTEFRDRDEPIKGVLFSAVVAFVFMGIIFTFYASHQRDNLPREERAYATYDLVALDANEDLNGSFQQAFFVGSGYIGEDLYYHFFYKTSKGIKYEKRFAEGNIYIIETDGEPKYVKYAEFISDTSSIYYQDRKWDTRDVLYIPKGTIKRNYKVND